MKNTIIVMCVGVLFQALFWSFLASVVGAEPIKNLRNRELHGTHSNPIPCNPHTGPGADCVCPGNCLTYYNSTGGCHPNNCWKWDEVKEECEEAGKEFLPAIILQGIPVTGVFGSGFGNMGRWDIFGIYWIVIGCGCLCSCCLGGGAHCLSQSEDKTNAVVLGCRCGNCLLSIAMTTMWIWGIVVIANREIDAPWFDWHGDAIMCPLVG